MYRFKYIYAQYCTLYSTVHKWTVKMYLEIFYIWPNPQNYNTNASAFIILWNVQNTENELTSFDLLENVLDSDYILFLKQSELTTYFVAFSYRVSI